MMKYQNEKDDPYTCRRQIKLMWERSNRYYLCFTYDKQKEECEKENTVSQKIVALDPGVRTFQTGYDMDGTFYEYGRGDVSRMYRLWKRMDQLISKVSKTKGRKYRQKRWRMKKVIDQVRFKMKNLVMDCHWKLANHLIDNYYVILIPKFEVSQMIEKGKRKMSWK